MITRIINHTPNIIRRFGRIYDWLKEISPISNREFIRAYYFNKFGYSLNLDKPMTFNEKIQWIKLYDVCQKYSYSNKYLTWILLTLSLWAENHDFSIN